MPTCRRLRQHELRRRRCGLTPVGLRPPCVRPRQRHTMNPPAEDPLSGTETLSRRSQPPLTSTAGWMLYEEFAEEFWEMPLPRTRPTAIAIIPEDELSW